VAQAHETPTGEPPVAELSQADESAQTGKKRQRREPKTKASDMAKKRSALDAAAQVLAQASAPLTCQELIAAMAAQGLWSSPAGKTPAATLYSALLRELQTKGDQGRFVKTERGKFALRDHGASQ
jgi:hypothetical protein